MGSFEWKDCVVVITGASAGIGAALAHEIGRRGGSLVLAARRRERLEEVAREVGAPAAVAPADVTRREDVGRVLSQALERFGRVDVWVNNAGRGITRAVELLTEDDLDTMMRENVKSALYGMQAIVPHFKERRRGHIVNVSSMLGRMQIAGFRSAYSAAKHALNSLTADLRTDLGRDFPEIPITLVLPGVVETDFGLNSLHGGVDSRSLPGAQPAREVAAIIADAIETRRNGDVYTRAEALERIVAHLRGLAKSP